MNTLKCFDVKLVNRFLQNGTTYYLKTMDFSETIEACDLKVGRYRQLFELMKVCEY